MCVNCQYLEFRVVSGLGCVGAKLNGMSCPKIALHKKV